MRIWNSYKKIVQVLAKIGIALGCVMLSAMCLLVGVEVVSRSVFGVSTLVADEYSSYLLVGLSFFGAAYALSSGNFINVDILYSKFPPKVKRWVDVVLDLMALAFIIFLFDRCWYVVSYSIKNHVLSAGLARTPLYIPQSTMVIGLALFILQLTVSIGDNILGQHSFSQVASPEKVESEEQEK